MARSPVTTRPGAGELAYVVKKGRHAKEVQGWSCAEQMAFCTSRFWESRCWIVGILDQYQWQ